MRACVRVAGGTHCLCACGVFQLDLIAATCARLLIRAMEHCICPARAKCIASAERPHVSEDHFQSPLSMPDA